MKYIYRMSGKMFWETLICARESNMKVEQYITSNFGIRGECVKVEVI